MRPSAWLSALARLSLAETLDGIRHPWKVRLKLEGERPVDPGTAAARLVPEHASRVQAYRREFLADVAFHETLNRSMVTVRGRRVVLFPWHELLYVAVRVLKPGVAVETGVFDGVSSAVLLRALRANGGGRLISIDLPARGAIRDSTDRMPETTLPPGLPPGWLIPPSLRDCHRLIEGDSRKCLPTVLDDADVIDLFFHDSLHTFAHQDFEYRAAWGRLRPGGLLLSDDMLASPAFHRFCREKRADYVRVETLGAARKCLRT